MSKLNAQMAVARLATAMFKLYRVNDYFNLREIEKSLEKINPDNIPALRAWAVKARRVIGGIVT